MNRELQKFIDSLTPLEAEILITDWAIWARDDQKIPPGDWTTWLLLGGRGSGKTRNSAEFIHHRVWLEGSRRIALIGASSSDVRDTMIEGESGLLNIGHPSERPLYTPSKRRLDWPNGAMATTYTVEAPQRLRGPQHDSYWWDEPCAVESKRNRDIAWYNLLLGLRLLTGTGHSPRGVCSTTPRAVSWLTDLVDDETCHVTRSSTFDNLKNLAPAFRDKIIARYEGTRIGRQELLAEILTDTPGALWTSDLIDLSGRYRDTPEHKRRVVGVDPPASTGGTCGIIIAGTRDDAGRQHFDILDDYSMSGSPEQWARAVVAAYNDYECDRVTAERNMGGDMVRSVMHAVANTLPVELVSATRGKRTRAEPVAALYEQHRVHHPLRPLTELEEQQTSWDPNGSESPDRVDALVWSITSLLEDDGRTGTVVTADSPFEESKVKQGEHTGVRRKDRLAQSRRKGLYG